MKCGRVCEPLPKIGPIGGGSSGGGSGAELTLIEQKVLGADAATVDFTNIPQTFQHLIFRGQVRGTVAGVGMEFAMRLGDGAFDSGTNYEWVHEHNGGGIVTSAGSGPTTLFQAARYSVPGSGATAGVFGEFQAIVQGYTLTSTSLKFVHTQGRYEDVRGGMVGRWNNSGICSRVRFLDNAGGNIKSASVVTLYGTNDLPFMVEAA